MTRSKSADYDKKRDSIINNAASLIAKDGFSAATMQDVADLCKASKSHIYHYFASKEELLYEIVFDHISRQARELKKISEMPMDAELRFSLSVKNFINNAAKERNRHIILMNELKHLPPKKRNVIKKLEKDITNIIENVLFEINPRVGKDLSKSYALLLFGMMIWTFSWYRRRGRITLEELSSYISDLYINGFKNQFPPAIPDFE